MKINKVKLFVNNDEKSLDVSKKLEKELMEYGFIIDNNDYDLAISIGGDGSFLKMVRENNFNNDIYYIGINSGTLGFLQEIDINNTINFVKRLSLDDYKIEELSYEEDRIYTDKQEYIYNSLNELVIRKNDFSILKGKILIDDELLEEFSGDGLLISTSTGSTAYNMSFHGPIVYNSLDTLILTPIAPLNNKVYSSLTNPLIVPNNKVITIIPDNRSLFFMIDGKIKEIDNINKIEINISNKKIKCLRMNDFHFVRVIRNKIIK